MLDPHVMPLSGLNESFVLCTNAQLDLYCSLLQNSSLGSFDARIAD